VEHVKGRAPEGGAERGSGAGGRRVGEGAAYGERDGRGGWRARRARGAGEVKIFFCHVYGQ